MPLNTDSKCPVFVLPTDPMPRDKDATPVMVEKCKDDLPGSQACFNTKEGDRYHDTGSDDTAWRFPTAEEIRKGLSTEFTQEQKVGVWVEAAEAVKTYHDGLVRRWQEELDTLLVYAGLFSAVLTAFNVQSYQLLQPSPTDPTLAVLREISAHMSSFTIAPPFVNTTRSVDASTISQPLFQAPASAVWLNTLWFCSLVFSLSSASIALFVKQWLHETTVQGTSRKSARLRQYRLHGLLKWHVGTIVVVLPILLQLAAVLFLGGLVILLWTLHSTVAAITSSLVAILFAFFLVVTVLPVWKADCPYRSPTSLAIYGILRINRNATMRMLRWLGRVFYTVYATMVRGVPQLVRLHEFAYRRHYLDIPTWRGRDQSAINERVGTLDRAIVTKAYTTTTDTKFLSYMPMIFPDLPSEEIVRCSRDISDYEEAEFGHGGIDWGKVEDPTGLPMMVMYALRHMLTRTDKGTHKWEWDCYEIVRHFYIPDVVTQRYAEITCRTMCQLAVEDPSYDLFSAQLYNLLIKAYGGRAHHTYDTLCHVRAVLEQALSSWNASDGWPGLMRYLKAVHCLLHYVEEMASGRSKLSPSQAQVLLAWGREALSRLQQWLRDLEWYGLHAECIGGTSLRADHVYAATFPHVASHYFLEGVLNPLIALRSTAYGRNMVSRELVSAGESAWYSARVAYPDAIDRNEGALYIWRSGLDRIDARLTELREAVVCPLNVN
ncbi:hypothetical protein C8T65DRAFT_827467 [Cerioporus squamosus]|nr:hypothetical protein C8T65DRAFT_827467 [Cerioporus squamosus]